MSLDLIVARGTGVLLALAVALASWLALPARADKPRVVVTDTETTILDVVEFAPGTATIHPRSLPTLDAVAATLRGNPSITLVEVQSHTSGIGDGATNLGLSELRAEAVMAYLVTAGVEPARLTAQGYGDTQPIARAEPKKNERIAFLILARAPDSP